MPVYVVNSTLFEKKTNCTDCDICWSRCSRYHTLEKEAMVKTPWNTNENIWYFYYHAADTPQECVMKDSINPNQTLDEKFMEKIKQVFQLEKETCEFNDYTLKVCVLCLRKIYCEILGFNMITIKNDFTLGIVYQFLTDGKLSASVRESTKNICRTKKAL